MATKLTGKNVESFLWMHKTFGYVCSFKGCRRGGQVKLFWREEGVHEQQTNHVCCMHALQLANEVLSEYKFDDAETA